MYKLPLYALGLLIAGGAFANTENCLTTAYPDITVVKNDTISFKNGTTVPLGQISNASLVQRLKRCQRCRSAVASLPLSL